MDETEGTKQDSLPGGGQTSAGAGGTTSTKDAKTYTEEEKQKEVEKAVSDALAEKGRDAKTLSDREAKLKDQEESIKKTKAEVDGWLKQKEEAELEEARSDPDKMHEYQRKQAEKQRKAELDAKEVDLKRREGEIERSKAEHEAEVKAARETMMEIKLWEIGSKYGIDPTALKELNLPTVEQVEAVAKRIGTLKPEQKEEGETGSKGTKPFTPDSGVTSGRFGVLTPEQFEKLPISEKEKYLAKK